MICPACNKNLISITEGEITLDICKEGCGGVWFDWLELKKFDESHEKISSEILSLSPETDTNIKIEKRVCPRCQDTVMLRHFSSIKREIEVDECGSCGGFFLDASELRKIRGEFKDEAEKNKETLAFVEGVFQELKTKN